MRGTLTLPDGYAGLCSIDLQKDKRLALLINGLALLIALPLVFLGNRIVPLRTLFSMDDGFGFYFLRLGMLTAGYAAYVVLHELVHGVCMKYFSGAPVRYGFTGLYAYARSEAYFTKKRYFYHRARAGGRLGRGAAGAVHACARAVVLDGLFDPDRQHRGRGRRLLCGMALCRNATGHSCAGRGSGHDGLQPRA